MRKSRRANPNKPQPPLAGVRAANFLSLAFGLSAGPAALEENCELLAVPGDVYLTSGADRRGVTVNPPQMRANRPRWRYVFVFNP